MLDVRKLGGLSKGQPVRHLFHVSPLVPMARSNASFLECVPIACLVRFNISPFVRPVRRVKCKSKIQGRDNGSMAANGCFCCVCYKFSPDINGVGISSHDGSKEKAPMNQRSHLNLGYSLDSEQATSLGSKPFHAVSRDSPNLGMDSMGCSDSVSRAVSVYDCFLDGYYACEFESSSITRIYIGHRDSVVETFRGVGRSGLSGPPYDVYPTSLLNHSVDTPFPGSLNLITILHGAPVLVGKILECLGRNLCVTLSRCCFNIFRLAPVWKGDMWVPYHYICGLCSIFQSASIFGRIQ